MKVTLSESGDLLTLTREPGDPKIYGNRYAAGEHRLMHHVKKWLNARGADVIKKRAQLDGHMIGDEFQPYLRTRRPKPGIPHIYVWSGNYALHGANEDWNKGTVELLVETDVFGKGQDTVALLRAVVESDYANSPGAR